MGKPSIQLPSLPEQRVSQQSFNCKQGNHEACFTSRIDDK